MDTKPPDRRVIACNIAEPTSEFSNGALCYVINTNPGDASDRIEILGRSRSGRWVQKWESIKRLRNFRFKTIPPEHPRFKDSRIADWLTPERLDELYAARARAKGENE